MLRSARRFFSIRRGGSTDTEFNRLRGEPTLVYKQGLDLVNNGLLNKGTAFTLSERDRLGIRGLVPPRVNSKEIQALRFRQALDSETDSLRKYSKLQNLMDRNETLFYHMLMENLEELAPIIYTPTVGLACQRFGHIYQRPRGMYFSARDRGEMIPMMYNWPTAEVDVIVVTDGGRILGLGDLGAHGMGIPIGKLSLYVAAGGIMPGRTLPVMIDVGTNNEELLQSPFYIGLPMHRLDGDEYFKVIDEFMEAVRIRFPNALVQFEDLTSDKALIVLEKYRTVQPCFNDDIQGTGAVVLAGLFNSMRAQGLDMSALRDKKIVIAGGGSAGMGVATAIKKGLVSLGLSEKEACSRFYILDVNGLISRERSSFAPAQREFARPDLRDGMSLFEVVDSVKPDILLGVSGSRGLFTEDVVRSMSKYCTRPVIFPLSNPTHLAECTAEDAYKWSEGRCLFASGSPFSEVEYDGIRYQPSQSNNMYIFPGVGLGVILSKARLVTDEMFFEAAQALASFVSDSDVIYKRQLFPRLSEMRRVSERIAVRIMTMAMNEGLSRIPAEEFDMFDDVTSFVRSHMWDPNYNHIVEIH